MYDELAAEEQGLAAATFMLDLTKAFESVPLATVWERWLKMEFHPDILRLALEVCAFSRVLTLEGAASGCVDSLSAILAGTSLATDILYVVMVEPCDRLQQS